jgi:hypothetical protein
MNYRVGNYYLIDNKVYVLIDISDSFVFENVEDISYLKLSKSELYNIREY